MSEVKSKRSGRKSEESVDEEKSKRREEAVIAVDDDNHDDDDDNETKKKEKRKHKKASAAEKEKEEETSDKKTVAEEPKAKASKSEELAAIDVHTANNWEKVDLGDEKRKLKFLKLMGATKHKDDKEPVHKHCRDANETKRIDQDLEKQFTEGLNTKLYKPHHVGLGFGSAGSGSIASRQPAQNTRITFGDDDNDNDNNNKNSAKAGDKQESSKTTPASTAATPATTSSSSSTTNSSNPNLSKYKKMSFVKSSS